MGATVCQLRLTFRHQGPALAPDVTNMEKALEGAVDVLGIGPQEETKREAVARFIIKLAEIDGGVDAASLRDKVIMALGGSIHLASLSKDGQPDPNRP
jgi:hypothetical protein